MSGEREILDELQVIRAELHELRRMLEDKGPQELTPKQAAEYLGVSVSTLAQQRCTGQPYVIPYEKKGGRVFYRRSVLDQHRRDQTFRHTAEETVRRQRRRAA